MKIQTCYTATCDDCGDEYENGEYTPHWPSASEAANDAESGGDWWDGPGQLLCDRCKLKPHPFTPDPVIVDCARCDLAADEHDEGQQR